MHQQLPSVNIISNVKNIGLGIVKHRSHDCLGLVQLASFSSRHLTVLELVPAPAQIAANRTRLSAEECSAVLKSEILSRLTLGIKYERTEVTMLVERK